MSDGKDKNHLFGFIKDIWKGVGRGSRKRRSYLLLALLLLGMVLMFAGSFFAPQKKLSSEDISFDDNDRVITVSDNIYEETLTLALKNVLENIEGINEVQVFINFADTEESFYAKTSEESNRQTTERDREGGTREIIEMDSKEDYVLLREAGGGEKALLLSKNRPRINGILVVAGGVENSLLRLKVVRAIQSVLDLPVHRIAVLPLSEKKNK